MKYSNIKKNYQTKGGGSMGGNTKIPSFVELRSRLVNVSSQTKMNRDLIDTNGLRSGRKGNERNETGAGR